MKPLQLYDAFFCDYPSIVKAGAAATGQNTNDVWSRIYGNNTSWQLTNTDGSVSAVGLTIGNAGYVGATGSWDPMYDYYVYADSGSWYAVTVTNLSEGNYEFYRTCEGLEFSTGRGWSDGGEQLHSQRRDCQSRHSGNQGCSIWRFTNVVIHAGQNAVLTVRPGAAGYAEMAGMQMVETGIPVADNQSVLVSYESSNSIVLAGTNVNGHTLTYAVSNAPTYGTLTGTPPSVI